jgi:hypothetical protein
MGRVITRSRVADDDVALFAHGHASASLSRAGSGCRRATVSTFLLNTGTLCVLGTKYRLCGIWNAPLPK